MKTVVFGECDPERIFSEEDATAPTESEFEFFCVKALACVYPEYYCIRFEAGFTHEGRTWKPDLALIARDFSHWFVLEVELVTHSFDLHVLPQVKALRYGDIAADDATAALSRNLGIPLSQARTIVDHVPRCVAVVVNRHQPEWLRVLGSHDIQFLSVATYRSRSGQTAFEVSGRITATKEVLAWATYVATDRSLRVATSAPVPEAPRVQLEDTFGAVAWWLVTRSEAGIWLTKEEGAIDLPPGQVVQIVKTYQGKLLIRVPSIVGRV